jgi:hypothetical protein
VSSPPGCITSASCTRCWRIEQAHLREGGFALIQGDPGTGKSVVMRLLAERLSRLADLSVGVIHHPQRTSPTFIASSATSSRSPSASATAGAGSRRCGHGGSITYDVTTGAEWGIFNLEGSDDAPRESQIKIVNDYVSGWLATVGILESLS